jgi:hypothetical protein
MAVNSSYALTIPLSLEGLNISLSPAMKLRQVIGCVSYKKNARWNGVGGHSPELSPRSSASVEDNQQLT